MRTLIETYRGWDIYFDTESEEFYTVSNQDDYQKTKKSYSTTKKFIDDYIKDNQSFKPILVQKMKTIYSNERFITLIGIRKDGAFMYEDEKGIKAQLSKYEEKDYFVVNNQNDIHFKELERLHTDLKKISNLIKEEESKIIKLNVEQIRKNLLNE
jgi:hypothetical protein